MKKPLPALPHMRRRAEPQRRDFQFRRSRKPRSASGVNGNTLPTRSRYRNYQRSSSV